MSDGSERHDHLDRVPADMDVLETSPLSSDALPPDATPLQGEHPVVTAPFDRLARFAAEHSTSNAPIPAPLNVILPARPTSIAETGLDITLLEELTLKHIASAGLITLGDLADRLCLPLSGVVEDVVTILRREGLVEFQNVGGNVLGNAGMRVRPTDRGLQIDQAARQQSGYVGPAPVTFGAYLRALRQQAMTGRKVSRSDVWRRTSHLVLSDDTIDRIGASIESGGPMLIYSASGNGKTSIAQAISRMFAGGVLVPHAVELDGLIMRVYDPGVHKPLTVEPNVTGAKLDDRWVYCHTPFVRVGTDLQMQQLSLYFNPQHREYECPIQLKAAGGVLCIDDVGTQQAPADELLSRCLEPVSAGVDHLITVTGRRVPVPFTSLLIAATGRPPGELLGERVLRRFPCKVHVPGPTKEQYRELFRRNCQEAGVECQPVHLEYLIERCFARPGFEPRSCHAGDLVRLLVTAARYFGIPPQFSPRLIDVATEMYFG